MVQVHVLRMPRLHRSQSPMAGQRLGGIRAAGWDNESYDDVLDIDGCYFAYVCVRNPSRARELDASKEAECSIKERMGTFTLSEFSGHRAPETGVGGVIYDGFRLSLRPPVEHS